MALPIGLSVNFILRFGIDVPYWDQWDFIPLLEQAQRGDLSFSDLTAQHNEHRILFPRLIMLALARLTRWDVRAEMWTGWSMLLLIGLLLHAELRRHVRSPWLATWMAVPPAWLVFSLRQQENFLWGWQLQVFLAALSAVVALWFLVVPSPLRIAAAALAGVVCSYSFGSGLAVWPAGAVVLLLGSQEARWRGVVLTAWAGAAGLTLLSYLHGFVRPAHHPSPLVALTHPLDALGFLGTALGASLIRSPPVLAGVVGWLMLFALGVLASRLIVQTGGLTDARFGLGLVTFAIGITALITAGRLGLDPSGDWLGPAMASRYTTLTMLGVYGLYRATLSLDPSRSRLFLGVGMVAMISLSSVIELGTEFRAGAREARRRRELRAALLQLPAAPDSRLEGLYPRPQVVRERGPVLRELGMGPFRSPRR